MNKLLVKFWPLALILILTFLLRTIRIEELFYFTYDESIPAFVGRRLILWQHIPLIGAATPFGFHLAPYTYWFYSLVLFFGNLNPIAWGWAAAAIATLTTLLIYKVAINFGSKKTGFIACSFWAFSYLANVYDRHFWALYWGPLVSLTVLYLLYKIIKKPKKSLIYLLAIVISLSIQTDPSNLIFLLLALIVFGIYKFPLKSTVTVLVIVILSFLPLAIFDLRHNFANTRPVLDFLKQGRNTPTFGEQQFITNSLVFPRAFSRLIYTSGDNQIARQYSYCRQFVQERSEAIPTYLVILSTLLIVSYVIWGIRQNRGSGWQLIAILIVLYFLGIQLYGTILRADVFEHYITGLFAPFLLILAKAASHLPKKLWLTFLAVFIAANLYKLSLAQNSHGLLYKRQAIEYTIEKVGAKPFSLDSLSTCWKFSGYRYLFAATGQEPVKSYVDPNFGYLYGPTPIAEKHPSTVVAFVIHDPAETEEFYARYALLKSFENESAIFGSIEVIILDNSLSWFEKVNIN